MSKVEREQSVALRCTTSDASESHHPSAPAYPRLLSGSLRLLAVRVGREGGQVVAVKILRVW